MRARLPYVRESILSLLGFFLLLLLLLNADFAADGIRQGLTLCANTLLPALFPFLVLSELLVTLHIGRAPSRLLGRPLYALLGVSGEGAIALLLGAVCGFPVGATTALRLHREGALEKKELARLLLFVNNPSAGFLIGVVGGALFGSRAVGLALFVITLLSALSCGMLLRVLRGPACGERRALPPPVQHRLTATELTGCVTRAFSSMLQVCAFLLFFSCLLACIDSATEATGLPHKALVAVAGLLELTSGIKEAVATLPTASAFRFCAFFSGFSGLSVLMQIFSVTEGEGLSLPAYLVAKLAQGGLCLLFAEGYLRLLCPVLTLASGI